MTQIHAKLLEDAGLVTRIGNEYELSKPARTFAEHLHGCPGTRKPVGTSVWTTRRYSW